MPSIGILNGVAYALVIAGSVLLVLGIFEIGGLFNVGIGLLVFWVGATTAFAEMAGRV